MTFKFRAEVNEPGSWKGHNVIPSMFFFSHSSGGCEAEPQCGPPHHLSRRPYWLPGGSVATAEHLHGPGFSAVHQGRVWEWQQSKWSLLTLPFHFLYSHEQKKISIHFQNEGHRFTWRPGLFFVSLFIYLFHYFSSFLAHLFDLHSWNRTCTCSICVSVHPCVHLFFS